MSHIADFISKVTNTYSSGHAREHSYRPALKEMFEKITELDVINEPKRSEYGAPDFIFLKPSVSKEKLVVAYAEAKDIDIVLQDVVGGEQMTRYYGYSNIILTNGLEFRFYKNATAYCEPIVIGELQGDKIVADEQYFNLLEDTIRDFIKESKEPIKSGNTLAKIMAGKARRIRDNIQRFLKEGNDTKNKDLLEVFGVVKGLLLAELDKDKFADMYAQTLVYGLFVARYYDKSQESFSRQEARDLVPASNPFLRHFFDHIAGPSFDPRIEVIVNELCEEFTHADVKAIIHDYYKVERDSSRDPIIHFYEDFLQEYDPLERKKMGVFYTPLPVVRFIVRAIDDILKKEFSLSQGLADSSKIEIERTIQGKKKKETVHRVQVLDPATGTGTFLNEAILHIRRSFEGQEGRWSSYVDSDLLPRLHGFELMMASYTIAHLKLSSTLLESGAKIGDTRLGVYLTNSLEKSEIEEQTLFSIGLGRAITEESNQANKVKNELPIMVIMGNPPYNISSQNKGDYISGLLKDYKRDLNEKKINLDDDYIKFIRFTESLIEKNGEGIVGMITNNSFIDGITHRQMRKHLLETFDSVYILDLHGNSKKKEKALDGGKDENVFAIQQGVSISIFVKKNKVKNKLGEVYHTEFYGRQKDKFLQLNALSVESTTWNRLKCEPPYYFFVPKDFSVKEQYDQGFKIDDMFIESGSGIITRKDDVTINQDREALEILVEDFKSLDENDLRTKYKIEDGVSWKLSRAKQDVIKNADSNFITKILYRPFDIRYTLFTQQSGGFLNRPVFNTSKHLVNSNFALVTSRMIPPNQEWNRILVSDSIVDIHSISDQSYVFPLYLYGNDGSKTPNLKKEIVDKVSKITGKTEPESIMDYIYAVLYCPNYRKRYGEFLKIDFPRVIYPKDKEEFSKISSLGRELRELHLFKSVKLDLFETTFTESGSDIVENRYPKYKGDKIYINANQYFGNINEINWNFHIGGYQPAQKWLKDRQGKKLSSDDITHFQKIVLILSETERIMNELNSILEI